MQRPTATRRGKSLLPCDDDDDRDDRDAKSRATRARKQDDNLRKANVAALILGFTYFLYYLNSSAFAPEVVLTTGPNYSEVLHSPTPEEIHEHTGVAPALPGTEPLKCHEFVHQVQLGTYRVHVEDPNKKTGIFSRKTTTGHPFRVSLHHEKLDKRKWVIMTKGRYSEHHLENIWADILRGSKPGARVLDVGGSIGYYSLMSASMGPFHVDSFEPNLGNALRFCESVNMNKWLNELETKEFPELSKKPTINVWPAGVAAVPGKQKFFESWGNPSAGRFGDFGNNRTDYLELPVTTLDMFADERGWFESRPEIKILKMDVDNVASAMVGAEKLLRSGIVHNVFTEVSLEDPDRKDTMAALEMLVSAGYKLKGQGGWKGPGQDSPWPTDENLVKSIYEYLEKEKKQYLNMWWKL